MKYLSVIVFAVVSMGSFTATAQVPPPDQTITIEEGENISVNRVGPAIEPVEVTRLEIAASLIEIREDFTDMTLEMADGL
jgi:hypothetical protein